MARTLILAQSKCTADALGEWIKLCGDDAPGDADPKRIVWEKQTGGGESGVLSYETLVKRIEAAAKMDDGSLALNDVVVLVDSVNPARMSATADGSGWDHLLAMLVLTFPEIKWVFGVITGNILDGSQHAIFPTDEHSLSSLVTLARRDPLLDPTGLRDWVRRSTNRELKDEGFALPTRLHRAAAIDEEKSFAYFHAYTAYRFGFRVDTVTSWALMKELFGGDDGAPHGYYLLLEDMSLKFPDKVKRIHLADFEDRARADACPKLGYGAQAFAESSRHRILITTGQSAADNALLPKNLQYLAGKSNGLYGDLRKPVGGMLDLWIKAGLMDELQSKGRAGNAPGFDWPPRVSGASKSTGHGSPGKLMLVAEILLRRADIFHSNACTVKDFIKGATLATEAAELLGGRTPTLTLAALALKHQYEARAECAFVGAGYHFDVKARRVEIERDVDAVVKWFEEGTRRKAKLDALVVILNRVAVVFREAGQFEEEQDAMVALRWAHRRLMFAQARTPFRLSTPAQWIVNGGLSYAEWLLASFGNFMLAILGWLAAITAAWCIRGYTPLVAIDKTINAFFGGNPVSEDQPALAILFSCGVVAIGIFHVGVFISYLYSLISRR